MRMCTFVGTSDRHFLHICGRWSMVRSTESSRRLRLSPVFRVPHSQVIPHRNFLLQLSFSSVSQISLQTVFQWGLVTFSQFAQSRVSTEVCVSVKRILQSRMVHERPMRQCKH